MRHIMKTNKHLKSSLVTLGLVTSALVISGSVLAAPKPKFNTPTISCGESTQASIDINVCAGATGAPAGFSLQWETADALAAGPDGILGTADDGQWNSSDSTGLCKASFSGNANQSRYNLAANECTSVNVGDFLFDEGTSSNCMEVLSCGADYVFRSFAHADSKNVRSDFTDNLSCGTLPCDEDEVPGDCTLTQGYWKTHTPLECTGDTDVDSNNPLCITWPVDNLTLGNVNYDVAKLVSILDKPAAGNGLISLAHQLIAAKLNIANGADGSSVSAAIAAADSLIASLVVPPVGSGYLAPNVTSSLNDALANFNEGATGPGHCE